MLAPIGGFQPGHVELVLDVVAGAVEEEASQAIEGGVDPVGGAARRLLRDLEISFTFAWADKQKCQK